MVSRLSSNLLHFYEDMDVDGLTDLAYQAWTDHADVLLDAMHMWYLFTVHDKGVDYVRWAVHQITMDVSAMDVDEPSSRSVFCNMLYAMYDESFTKAMEAWGPVREREDWPVACEVLSLMLAYVGHFIGVPHAVQTEEPT